MFQLGEKQRLIIAKKVEFGVYLSEDGRDSAEKVLLPVKQVPAGSKVGDALEVFLYRDSRDRVIATTKEPKLMMGQVALLTVVQTGKVGAFLDWGLEKDLFLPYREQTTQVKAGDEVIAALYLDKSERLCATMKVYPYLQKESPYQKDDVGWYVRFNAEIEFTQLRTNLSSESAAKFQICSGDTDKTVLAEVNIDSQELDISEGVIILVEWKMYVKNKVGA